MSLIKLSNFTESIEKAYGKTTALNEGLSVTEDFRDAYDWSEEAAEDKAKFDTALEREIARVLREHGYNPEYNSVVAAADYIEMAREYADEDYSVEEWLKDTEDNYPEELEKINESAEEPMNEEVEKFKKKLNENYVSDYNDLVEYLADALKDELEENPEMDRFEAAMTVVNDKLIYYDDQWTVFRALSNNEPEITGEMYDELYNDVLKKEAEMNESLNEEVEDIYFYSNSEFKDDLAWLADDLTHYFFKEMESAHWGLSKADITDIFKSSLDDVLQKMRESDGCTLFESVQPSCDSVDCALDFVLDDVKNNDNSLESAVDNASFGYSLTDEQKRELINLAKEELNEDIDVASARPNHMKILDALENGYVDYQMVAEELLRWMPDDELADFVNMYLDYEEE